MKFFSKIRLFGTDIFVKDSTARDRISKHYTDHVRDIINGNSYTNTRTGDIENYGTHSGTDSDPYETLEHFFNLLNEGYTDIRCYIDTPGTYIVHKPVHTNCVVHLTVRANNVKIILGEYNEPFVGYSVHWNWDKSENVNNPVITTNGDRIYFDNSLITISGYDFNKFYAFYGGSAMLTDCSFTQFYSDMANVVLYKPHIKNTDNKKSGVVIRRSSQCAIYGELNVDRLSNDSSMNHLINIERSNAVLECSLNNANTGYYHGINSSSSIVNITASRLATFQSNTIAGNSTTNSLLITSNNQI